MFYQTSTDIELRWKLLFLVLLGFFCWSLSTFCRRMWRQKSRSHLFLWKNCHLPHWEICTMIWWEVLWSWIFRWPTRNRRLLGAFLPGSISSGSGPGWSGTSTSRTSTTSANTTRTIRWWYCKCFLDLLFCRWYSGWKGTTPQVNFLAKLKSRMWKLWSIPRIMRRYYGRSRGLLSKQTFSDMRYFPF